jgi:hypothetical protein
MQRAACDRHAKEQLEVLRVINDGQTQEKIWLDPTFTMTR